MDITKVCDPQVSGNNDIDVQACNAGTANLVNCSATDTVYTEDPLCDDGLTGATTDVPLTPVPFDLPAPAPGAPPTCATLDGTVPGLLDDACNNVTVTCDVEGSGDPPKTITASAQDECEVQPDECLTRTPGFWGTHPGITQQVLDAEIADATPIINCGVTMTNTTASTPGSATEDMCSVGTDRKDVKNIKGELGTSPQQIQLARQCTAAALNLAVSKAAGLSCDTEFAGIFAKFDKCCGIAAPDPALGTPGLCGMGLLPNAEVTGDTLNTCIGFLDAFNNAEFTKGDDFDAAGLINSSAEPEDCQDAKNNGVVNTSPPGVRKYGPVK
jgi:hypothetical protein